MSSHTILVTGGNGQVGLELLRKPWPADVSVLAPSRKELDLSSGSSITAWFAGREVDCIINTAAYTAVDLAEEDVGAAFLTNAQGPAWLADVSRERNIPLIHVSTDYVFDGALDRPYREEDPVAPLGIYGASKLAGELAVRAGAPRHVVVRTAWVISSLRNNFLKTMLRLAAERTELRVVADQHGCPTSAGDIAAALQKIALMHLVGGEAPSGTYHFVNGGSTTWHGLAETVMAASRALGGPAVPVIPIASTEFVTRALRPTNSRLETTRIQNDFGIVPRPWQQIVEQIISELSLLHSESEEQT